MMVIVLSHMACNKNAETYASLLTIHEPSLDTVTKLPYILAYPSKWNMMLEQCPHLTL